MSIQKYFSPLKLLFGIAMLLVLSFIASVAMAEDPVYPLVLSGGRVIDPETGLDAIRDVAIDDGKIVAISEHHLTAKQEIDVSGLVVAPGFIDLHTHSPTLLGQDYQVMDGVTTALELEAGSFPSNEYGEHIVGQARMNFGSSASHLLARIHLKHGIHLPHLTSSPSIANWTGVKMLFLKIFSSPRHGFEEKADAEERQTLNDLIAADLEAGALGIGLPLDYMSEGVDAAELASVFDVAAEYKVPVFVHVRRGINGDPAGLLEVLDEARRTGGSVHICHIAHNAIKNIELFLAEIRRAQADGIDVTTEIFPYNAGSAHISSAVFNRNWREIFGIDYADVQWAASGERMTEQTFKHFQQSEPQGQVIHHYLKEQWTRRALVEPGVMVVSDLLPMETLDKKVAPHNNSFSKVLARYVRETPLLDLSTALAKMSLLPARRLESFAPAFKRKGRIQLGADADITVFDANRILDRATYANPYQTALGISHVLVNGVPVVRDGKLQQQAYPGKRITALMPLD